MICAARLTTLFFCLIVPSLAVAADSPPRFFFYAFTKAGFLDAAGNVVIEPQFDQASGFAEGLAAVTVAGKCGYINSDGSYVIQPRFDKCSSFHFGYGAVSSGTKSSWVDSAGSVGVWKTAVYCDPAGRNGQLPLASPFYPNASNRDRFAFPPGRTASGRVCGRAHGKTRMLCGRINKACRDELHV